MLFNSHNSPDEVDIITLTYKEHRKVARGHTTCEQESQSWNLVICIFDSPRPYTHSHLLILGVYGSEKTNFICAALSV